jgi:predicted nucleotide-binding protein
MTKDQTQEPNGGDPAATVKKKRVTSDFPKRTLQEALRVPAALDKNGGRPLPPIDTAMAMGLSPGSFLFRNLLSASIKYGLSKGTEKATVVEMLVGGESVTAPKTPVEKSQALTAAALKPTTFRRIFDYYKGKKFPESEFFANTVVRQFGVPKEHAEICEQVFRANMKFVGLLKETSGGLWLGAEATGAKPEQLVTGAENSVPEDVVVELEPATDEPVSGQDEELGSSTAHLAANDRVFITHGKNTKIVEQVKQLLVFGKFEPIVSLEKHTISKPVPDKVLDDMRMCAAAVIHVGTDERLIDQAGIEHKTINSNVLIEIGAAMALYGRNFILLVEHGTELPSNLQGLYEVRYEGEGLDHEATMNLLKAFNDFEK